jgi:hypothetical protein
VLPHIAPQFQEFRDEFRARRQARRQRRRHAPFSAHDGSEGDDVRDHGPRSANEHELKSFDPSEAAASSGVKHLQASSGLRSRISAQSAASSETTHTAVHDDSSDVKLIDAVRIFTLTHLVASLEFRPHSTSYLQPQTSEIPYVPLTPSPNPWSASHGGTPASEEAPTSYSPSRSPFQLGSDTPTHASVTPARILRELDSDSPTFSPISTSPMAPQIQLPTPTASPSPTLSPSLSELSEVRAQHASVSEDDEGPRGGLNPFGDYLAPGMSRSTTLTSGMAESFVTANSPGTEFRSLPPTEPTSPLTEASFLSADDDDMTMSSFGSPDLPAFVHPMQQHILDQDEIAPLDDPFAGFTPVRPASTAGAPVVGSPEGPEQHLSDDEGSNDGSWEELSPPLSPRTRTT